MMPLRLRVACDLLVLAQAACVLAAQAGEGPLRPLEDLLREVSSDDDVVWCQAAKELGRHGEAAAAAVPRLVKLFSHKYKHPMTLICTLGQIGPAAKDAVGPIKAQMANLNPVDQVEALYALYRIGDSREEHLDGIISALQDPDRDRQGRALEVVRRLGPAARKAVPNLVAVLKTPDKWHHGALWALKAMGPEAAEAVPQLILMLSNKGCRSTALEVLAAIGPGAADAIPVLVQIVRDVNADNRSEASSALAAMGPKGLLALKQLLGDKDEHIWETSIHALKAMGPPAVPLLLSVLGDRVRGEWAAFALAEMKPPQVGVLLTALSGPDRWAATRAAEKLAAHPELLDSRAVRCALDALAEDCLAARKARSAATKAGPAAAPNFLDDYAQDRASACRDLLANMDAGAQAAALWYCLLDSSQQPNLAVAAGRGGAEMPHSLPMLVRMVGAPSGNKGPDFVWIGLVGARELSVRIPDRLRKKLEPLDTAKLNMVLSPACQSLHGVGWLWVGCKARSLGEEAKFLGVVVDRAALAQWYGELQRAPAPDPAPKSPRPVAEPAPKTAAPPVEPAPKERAPAAEPATKSPGPATEPPPQLARKVKTYVLADGTRIRAVSVIKTEEEFILTDEEGKSHTVSRESVKNIIEEPVK